MIVTVHQEVNKHFCRPGKPGIKCDKVGTNLIKEQKPFFGDVVTCCVSSKFYSNVITLTSCLSRYSSEKREFCGDEPNNFALRWKSYRKLHEELLLAQVRLSSLSFILEEKNVYLCFRSTLVEGLEATKPLNNAVVLIKLQSTL